MVDSYNTAYGKKETTYGTDAVPTATLNALLTRNFQGTPLEVDTIERNLDVPSRGASPVGTSNARQTFSYEVELAGSGAAGTAAPWMELLEGCGMAAATLTASVKAEQKFAAIGANLSALTHYWYTGNQRRRALGCRGAITSINFTAGAYPFLGLSWTGLIPTTTPFDATAMGAAPDYTRWKDPQEVNTVNTDFLLDGFAAPLRSFVLQDNANIALRRLVGSDYVQRGNHRMTGKIVIEEPAQATKDYLARLQSGAKITTQLVHGLTAGNIVQVDASYLQVTAINETNEDDIAMFEIDVLMTVNAGQDDVLLTSK